MGYVKTRAIDHKLESKTCLRSESEPSLSIKDKQIIISRLDKGEKGTNLAQEFGISIFLINIHIFDYPDSRLSGLFTEVPTSPDNRGSTIPIC